MSTQILTMSFNGEINESLQLGDTAYYSTLPAQGGSFSGSTATASTLIIAFGIVSGIDRDTIPRTISVVYDNGDYDFDGSPDITPPSAGDYIMFSKDRVVNSSSLLGYYAEVKFINNSQQKAELFSVGSEVSESSK